MADWSVFDADWQTRAYECNEYRYPCYYQEKEQPHAPRVDSPELSFLLSPPEMPRDTAKPFHPPQPPPPALPPPQKPVPRVDNPREIRNKAEKQRRDKLNQSIAELASIVPPVVASTRKIDKTGVLRLTAHYLRAHQYVFGDSIESESEEFNSSTANTLLSLLNGFLLTTTYRGLVVVVSPNMQQVLGYTELDLLGQSLFSITHKEDHNLLRQQLTPSVNLLGASGELLVPEDAAAKKLVQEILSKDQRRFIVRFKKHGLRSEPEQYVSCHVEGSFRKSDRACRRYNRCCAVVRRARARAENPCNSGNDVVFISVVRPTVETFENESRLESFRMEYRTRHSIDGEIIQCEQRIAMVTGYMTHEVNGTNALSFMHKDDVQWVIIALRDMYVKKRLFGESCFRLLTKNGQFIYMRTRGCLDVDSGSRAVTSFICTNTVVNESEGKHLIKLMKKKFALTLNKETNKILRNDDDLQDVPVNEALAVGDPRLLEKDILRLVTDLPSPSSELGVIDTSDPFSPHSLALIPPKRERIVSAIGKIYSVIEAISKSYPIHHKMLPHKPMKTNEQPCCSSSQQLNEYEGDKKMASFEEIFMQNLEFQSDFEEDTPMPEDFNVSMSSYQDTSGNHNNGFYVYQSPSEEQPSQLRTVFTRTPRTPILTWNRIIAVIPKPIQLKIEVKQLMETVTETNSTGRKLSKREPETPIPEPPKKTEKTRNTNVTGQNVLESLDSSFFEISSVLNSLLVNIDQLDPFPDLLSQEVQDILDDMEKNGDEKAKASGND